MRETVKSVNWTVRRLDRDQKCEIISRCLKCSDIQEVTSDGKSFHMEGATSNSREFNSGNKQMIGGGGPESLWKRGDGCSAVSD